jgi:hypothetical protein
MVEHRTHPAGPAFAGAFEDQPRHCRNLMPPRPRLNALGPAIPAWWQRELKKIDKRFVLQFHPTGRVQGSPKVIGFWAVCTQLPRSGLLFKQHVMTLVGQDGCHRTPDARDLRRIKEGWWTTKNQGFYAIFDAIDRNADIAEAEYEQRCQEEQIGLIDRILVDQDPFLNTPRVCLSTPRTKGR